MTVKSLYPTVLPSLNLDFANSKTLDPRITFTRASIGTYMGGDSLIKTAGSNAARFDHDPATNKCLGLLVEEARTNNIVPSNPSSAGWAPTPLSNYPATSGITFNQANTLTGGNTAASFNSGSSQLNYGAGTINSGTTLSFYITGVTAAVTLNMVIPSTGGGSIVISSSYGITLSSNGGWLTNGTINNVGKGWYRVSATINATSGNCQFNIVGGNSGVLLDLFQLEAGSFPTSYIPTVASTVTRAADVASMTGTNFSSWYNASAGCLVVNANTTSTNNFQNYIAIRGASFATNRLSLYMNSTGQRLYYVTPGSVTSVTPAINTQTSGAFKVAVTYNSTSVATTSNGSIATTTATNDVSTTLTTLDLSGYDNPPPVTRIARLTYYPVRLPDAQLQALTR
jgi:hypothetical protein